MSATHGSTEPLSEDDITTCARLLAEAEAAGRPIPPLVDTYGAISPADAYRIQLRNVERRRTEGDDVVGMKAGLTSKAMQQLLGVDQPDFGHLFRSMSVENGGRIDLASCMQPRIEAEVGVVLKADLSGDRVSVDDVARATGALVASLEIVESRIADWRITIGDTIADNASCGKFVIGHHDEVGGRDPRLIGVVVSRNGIPVESGVGAAVMGNPFASVAWLAETLTALGSGLRAGQVVLPGAVHAMVPVQPGDHFLAEFAHIGNVEVTFVSSGSSGEDEHSEEAERT